MTMRLGYMLWLLPSSKQLLKCSNICWPLFTKGCMQSCGDMNEYIRCTVTLKGFVIVVWICVINALTCSSSLIIAAGMHSSCMVSSCPSVEITPVNSFMDDAYSQVTWHVNVHCSKADFFLVIPTIPSFPVESLMTVFSVPISDGIPLNFPGTWQTLNCPLRG